MNYEYELKELLRICKPIITETVEQWSTGEDCYQAALDHITKLETKLPATIEKTEDNYEAYLNDLYEEQPHENVMENFIYLTNVSRGKSMTSEVLYSIINNGSVGTMLREYDPIAFTTGYNDWKP